MQLVKVQCTFCDSILEVVEKNDFYVCPYCKNHYYVKAAKGKYDFNYRGQNKQGNLFAQVENPTPNENMELKKEQTIEKSEICVSIQDKERLEIKSYLPKEEKEESSFTGREILSIIYTLLAGVAGWATCWKICPNRWVFVIPVILSIGLPIILMENVDIPQIDFLVGFAGVIGAAFLAPVIQYFVIFVIWAWKVVSDIGLQGILAIIIFAPIVFFLWEFGGWKDM